MATVRAGAIPENAKKSIDSIVFHLQESLLEGKVSQQDLENCKPLFTSKHLKDVIEERALNDTCGWPLCDNSTGPNKSAKYRISLRERRIFERGESAHYCGVECQLAATAFIAELSSEDVYSRQAVLDHARKVGAVPAVVEELRPPLAPAQPRTYKRPRCRPVRADELGDVEKKLAGLDITSQSAKIWPLKGPRPPAGSGNATVSNVVIEREAVPAPRPMSSQLNGSAVGGYTPQSAWLADVSFTVAGPNPPNQKHTVNGENGVAHMNGIDINSEDTDSEVVGDIDIEKLQRQQEELELEEGGAGVSPFEVGDEDHADDSGEEDENRSKSIKERDNEHDAAIWREVFGDDVPMPEDDDGEGMWLDLSAMHDKELLRDLHASLGPFITLWNALAEWVTPDTRVHLRNMRQGVAAPASTQTEVPEHAAASAAYQRHNSVSSRIARQLPSEWRAAGGIDGGNHSVGLAELVATFDFRAAVPVLSDAQYTVLALVLVTALKGGPEEAAQDTRDTAGKLGISVSEFRLLCEVLEEQWSEKGVDEEDM